MGGALEDAVIGGKAALKAVGRTASGFDSSILRSLGKR